MQSGLACKGPVPQALGQGSVAAGFLPAACPAHRLTEEMIIPTNEPQGIPVSKLSRIMLKQDKSSRNLRSEPVAPQERWPRLCDETPKP